jgi:hypothetical protein
MHLRYVVKNCQENLFLNVVETLVSYHWGLCGETGSIGNTRNEGCPGP